MDTVDFAQWGSDWHEQMRHAHLTQPVTYVRPGVFTVTLAATFGASSRDIDDGNGVLLSVETYDFKVRRADLLYGDPPVTFLPHPGDRISFARGSNVYWYDVNYHGGEPPWVEHDRFKDTIVIHTDQIQINDLILSGTTVAAEGGYDIPN